MVYTSFFISQLEGDDVGAGVETQGCPFFMALAGGARTAGQWHFEEVLKDVTAFQRDEGTFQKNTEVFLPGMWGMSGNIKQDKKPGLKQ